MAKKRNPDSGPRPQTPEQWAKATPHIDKATGKPTGMTEHQRAVQVSREQGRPLQDVLDQKFKAFHVNAGTVKSSDLPPGRGESRKQADRRRGSEGPKPTEVRTDPLGNPFRARVGETPTTEDRGANLPKPSAESVAAVQARAEKRGETVVDPFHAAVALESEQQDARDGGSNSSIISGPGGRSIRPLQQQSLRDPGVISDAGPVHEGPASEENIQADLKKGRGRLKKAKISSAGGSRTKALETIKKSGTTPGFEKLSGEVPRDAQGQVIHGTMQQAPKSIQAVDMATENARSEYELAHARMANDPKRTLGNMSNADFENYRAAEDHLIRHAGLASAPAPAGATIHNEHIHRGEPVPAGSQQVRGEEGKPQTRAAIATGDAKAEAAGNSSFLEAHPHPGTFQEYVAAQPPGKSNQFHQAGYQAALSAHETAKQAVTGSPAPLSAEQSTALKQIKRV